MCLPYETDQPILLRIFIASFFLMNCYHQLYSLWSSDFNFSTILCNQPCILIISTDLSVKKFMLFICTNVFDD